MNLKNNLAKVTQAYCSIVDNFFQWILIRILIKKSTYLKILKSVYINEKTILACLFLIALTIRISVYAILSPAYYPLDPSDLSSDSRAYDLNAINGITNGEFSTYWQPGISFILGIIYLIFGHNIIIASLLLILIGSYVGIISYLISKYIFSQKKAGYLSFFLIAIYPYLILESPKIMSDTFALFIFTSSLYYIIKDFNEKRLKYSLIIGFLTGVLLLTRPNYFWVPPLYLILTANSFKGEGYLFLLKKYIFFSITLLLVITPWIIYTDTKLGEPTLTTNGGVNFYIGNNHNSTGRYCDPYGLKENNSEILRSREGFKKGLDYIFTYPADYFALCLKKIDLLLYIPQRLPSELTTHSDSNITEMLFSSIINLGFIAIQLVGIRGLIYSKGQIKNKQISNFIIGSLFFLYTTPIVFFVYVRATIPIIFIWILISSPYLVYIIKVALAHPAASNGVCSHHH
ncbi:hypothetical protein MSBRW_3326 [Methanosarcina barkeri str. Wiesmoor]|uniref:Glycosyltransferase RgtA/B/C/D-like domain-containing protein n=2 Tax=Methanosarcina barkeri TaxID=2208 RepID=A0A0E3QQV0_METBA|nr:glycosyltransferase family 39 protein [Methanosarcina barkeri]AKB52579.1 hypothetical protein MSBRW_3326 [Methanosarcina barkeri str. Wiesmoor]